MLYAPSNEAEERVKDEFYEQLQREVERAPRHDVLFNMGDANAKVGQDDPGWERVIRRQRIGRMNENGKRLAEFCALNDLVIGGTLFKHRDIHKLTWTSPNGRDRNQIDHIIINGRYRREIRNTFEALANNEDGRIDQDWLQLRKAYSESADAVRLD